MAENELVKDDLAIEQSFEQMIENEIALAEIKGEKVATITLKEGKATINIKIEKGSEPGDYTIYMQGYPIANRKSNGKDVNYSYTRNLRYVDDFITEFNIEEAIRVHNKKMQEKNDSSAKLQKELEQAIKDGKAEPIRTGREITSGEPLSELTNRMFGDKMHEVYRIRGNDAHSFKYVGLNNAGKYVEFGGSTKHEGTNPDQKVFILTTAGKLEEKTVDHLTTNGKYAIATDIPDSAIADRTRTLVGNRLPSGRYLFIEALDSRNASASNNEFVKEILTRGESQYDMEVLIDVMELSPKIEALNSDGVIQSEEIELALKLRNEGYNDDEITTVINYIHSSDSVDINSKELDNTKIRAILDSTETTAEQIKEAENAGKKNEENRGNRENNSDSANNQFGDETKDRTKKGKNEPNRETEDEVYIGYGQRRPRPF